jgi:dTDP-4-dehydrorhamnose reductase
MRVLVTGARGMLGQDIVKIFLSSGHEVIATDRQELDITDAASVEKFVSTVRPELIINTAAYNLVEKVENPSIYPLAFSINATGPENLALAAKAIGAKFVHYSSDYVFAGDQPQGYTEEALPNPISKYGETKAAGEAAVRDVGGNYYLCRLSKIFGAPGVSDGSKESFVALMLRLAKEKPELKIVDEEVGTPTYTKDIAAATLQLITKNYPAGIYHLVNSGGGVTWYGFAREIFDLANSRTPFRPVPSSEFPKGYRSPKFAELLNTKFPALRPRIEALRDFLS